MSEEDYVEFQKQLFNATRTVFTNIQKQNHRENFYAFGLFHEPLWGYITTTANSEEGLVRKAKEYKLDKHNLGYAQRSLEEIMRSLRWNCGDWDYHNFRFEGFEALNDWMTEKNFYWKYPDDEEKSEQFDNVLK